MKIQKMPWVGIAGFAAGILCGAMFLQMVKPSGRERSPHFSDTHKRNRHTRPEPVGKSQEASQRVFFDTFLASLPIDQQKGIRSRMAPLLREVSTLGIGEYAYADLASLAIADAAREHPDVTFRYLLEQGDPTMQGYAFAGVLHEWLLQDSAAAGAAVTVLAPGGRKDAMERILFQEALSIDPAKALEFLQASDNPSPPDYYYAFLSLSKVGVESAIMRAAEIDNKDYRTRAIAGIAETYAKEQPDKAWEWALGNEGDSRLLAAAGVLTKMLAADPTAAIRTIEELQSREVKGAIVGRTIQEIAKQNAQAAYRLVNETLSGYDRHCALSGIMASGLEGDRLPQIQEMLRNEPAGKYRDNLVNGFAQNWAQTDPGAAYQWLQETGGIRAVSAEFRDRLSRGEKSPGDIESGIRFK